MLLPAPVLLLLYQTKIKKQSAGKFFCGFYFYRFILGFLGNNIKNIKIRRSNNMEHRRHRSKGRGLLSKCMNFICALIIMLVVLFSIGAFVEADFRTRSIAGNHSALFSYVRHEDNTAQLTAFGESVTINFNRLDSLRDRFVQVAAVNRGFAPSFINLSGTIIRGSLSAVGEWFGRIPHIIGHFMLNR